MQTYVSDSKSNEVAENLPRTVSSVELLQGLREIIIRHGEENYRLRLTRAGKLILNK
jgi:hemin uptake protein HemP